jgi:hypothetical protein
MVTKKFSDFDGNELTVYVNASDKIYLACGDFNDDLYYSGHICLDKHDAKELVKELQKLIKLLPNE